MQFTFILRMRTDKDRMHSCIRKVRYGHEETAAHAVDRMNDKTGKEFDAYRCVYCHGWHIGTSFR